MMQSANETRMEIDPDSPLICLLETTATATAATTITRVADNLINNDNDDNDDNDDNEREEVVSSMIEKPLRREKKSVFWLEDDDGIIISRSCRLVLAVKKYQQIDQSPFYVGGFQLISTAKNVRVYLTKISDTPTTEEKDLYLTTCKGLPISSSSSTEDPVATNYYKAMCVIPGGPRPVKAVLLRFEPIAIRIRSIRWTVRVPDEPTTAETTTAPMVPPPQPDTNHNNLHNNNMEHSNIQPTPMQQQQPPPPAMPSEWTKMFWSFHFQNQRKMDQILSQQQLILQQNQEILRILKTSNPSSIHFTPSSPPTTSPSSIHHNQNLNVVTEETIHDNNKSD